MFTPNAGIIAWIIAMILVLTGVAVSPRTHINKNVTTIEKALTDANECAKNVYC
jgi:hypothetical protein